MAICVKFVSRWQWQTRGDLAASCRTELGWVLLLLLLPMSMVLGT